MSQCNNDTKAFEKYLEYRLLELIGNLHVFTSIYVYNSIIALLYWATQCFSATQT